LSTAFLVLAVGTGVVVIVVAVAVVLVVVFVTASMRGRQMRSAQRRGGVRRDAGEDVDAEEDIGPGR
jgi:multisubunit Na+/H+ antiporter MnhG subunit